MTRRGSKNKQVPKMGGGVTKFVGMIVAGGVMEI